MVVCNLMRPHPAGEVFAESEGLTEEREVEQ